MDFLKHTEGFPPFLYSVHKHTLENCKRLREFEEIDISRQRSGGDFEQQGGKLLR